ncbi:PH domain-containing protein [Actinorugispora endophytica]|uniref:PH (Pleckstrin Homology) domain-containing protein n=1 Tax=Actinorugispora endophytica TaxID=1605990 RepID=A0A4R6UI37_9ACTN|nr:PH domain-containing protein [Actinorugispora endophytica]TDQ45029.1 PH (Pleckstrin Homology) domain-containing protein [Actinorugispora endophytica]
MRVFKQPLPRVLGWVWIGVSVLLLADLALNGTDGRSLVAAAVVLFTVGVTYVVALRPRVVAAESGVRLVNPLREVFVPWHSFTWADVTDVLRVHAGDRVFRSWPLRETKRAEVRANLRRANGVGDGGRDDPREMRPTELAAWELRSEAERRKAQPPGTVRAAEGGAVGPLVDEPTVLWSPDAVAALAVPLVLLVGALAVL